MSETKLKPTIQCRVKIVLFHKQAKLNFQYHKRKCVYT